MNRYEVPTDPKVVKWFEEKYGKDMMMEATELSCENCTFNDLCNNGYPNINCDKCDRDDYTNVIFKAVPKENASNTSIEATENTFTSTDEQSIIYNGKHLKMVSKNGWEYVSRTNNIPKKPNAVTIIAKDIVTDKWMCIIEKRIPIMNHSQSNGKILSLPAGLVDDNDSIEETAIREFKEETGYVLDVKKVSSLGYTSAGMTDESSVNVYGTFNSETDNEQDLQDSEDIVPIMIKDLNHLYAVANDNGYSLTNKIIQHFETLELEL